MGTVPIFVSAKMGLSPLTFDWWTSGGVGVQPVAHRSIIGEARPTGNRLEFSGRTFYDGSGLLVIKVADFQFSEVAIPSLVSVRTASDPRRPLCLPGLVSKERYNEPGNHAPKAWKLRHWEVITRGGVNSKYQNWPPGHASARHGA